MPYRTCDHLKEDGIYCSSPALRDHRYCYFHLNTRARRVQAARARLHGDSRRFQMPVLDNMHAVQAGIQQVVDALADDRLDNRRAGLLLYALQQAAASLKTTPGWQGQRPQLEADEPLRALEVRTLQNQYGLPFDTDLDARPTSRPRKSMPPSLFPSTVVPGKPSNLPSPASPLVPTPRASMTSLTMPGQTIASWPLPVRFVTGRPHPRPS